jgi:hypothetical protein
MSTLSPEVIAAVVQLGIKLATTAIEQRARRPVAQMTDADVLQAIADIEIRSVDELIEEGRKRADGGGKG